MSFNDSEFERRANQIRGFQSRIFGFVKVMFIVVPVLIVLSFITGAGQAYFTQNQAVVTVTKTERVCSGGEQVSCKYLVYTDRTTYENRDELWLGKVNSSDLYGRLKNGQSYRVKFTGWRFPLFSWYPNIVEAEPVTK